MAFDTYQIERTIGEWVPYSSDWFSSPIGIFTNLIIPLFIGTLGIGYLLRFMFARTGVLRKIPGLNWIIAVGFAFAGASNPVIRPFLIYGGILSIAFFKYGKWKWKILVAIGLFILIVVLYWYVIPLLESMTRGMF